MARIDVPFTDGSVNTDDPIGALSSISMIILGFAVFSMASGIGENLGGRLNSLLGSVLGFNPATGDDEGVDLL